MTNKANTSLERKAVQEDKIATEQIAAVKSARALGLEPDPQIYALGQNFVYTSETIQRSRAAWDRLPLAKSALVTLRDRVRAEKRIDVKASIKDLVMSPNNGYIARADTNGVPRPGSWRPYLRRAMVQLAGRIPRKPRYMGQYLCDRRPAKRAPEFNDIISENKDHNVVLRLRKSDASALHHIYAAVTPSYQAYDPDQLATDLIDLLDGDMTSARAEVEYAGVWTKVRLIAPSILSEWRVCAQLKSNDDTRGTISVHAEAYHVASKSFFKMKGTAIASIKHVGSKARFSARVQEAVKKVQGFLAPWMELWADRRQVAVNDIEAALKALTGADDRAPWLKVAGIKPKALFEKLVAAWNLSEDKDASQAGLSMLLAKAAHEQTWPSEGACEALENAATALVTMTSKSFLNRIAPLKEANDETNVDAKNEALAARVSDLHGKAKEWDQAAQEASENDKEWTQERAELYAIQADQVAEDMM